MNTIYALILISSMGGIEEKYKFQSLDDCQKAQQMIDAKTMCVALNVRKPSEDMKDFFNQFNETVKEFKKNNEYKETL